MLQLVRKNALSLYKKNGHGFTSFQFFYQNDIYGYLGVIRSRHTYAKIVGVIPQKPETKNEDRVFNKPVDWLPFKWYRMPMFNIFKQSGDNITKNECDLSLPKPNFELSEELKNADEQVKQYFSLATGSTADINEVCRRQVLKRIQRHPNDFKSLEVKIALRTIQLRSLFEYKRTTHKDERVVSRIIFPIIIKKRNKLLKRLREIDEDRFNWLLEELQLYYYVPLLGFEHEMYCKKWDLRRLTKEYCTKLVADKKAAYHAELKQQQEEFLEEKKQALAWIEEEEKALQAMKI